MKIAVIGLGYVGASLAVCLSSKFDVVGYDIDENRVAKINSNDFSFLGESQYELIKDKGLALLCHNDFAKALNGADFVIVAVPTDYDPSTARLDTSIVEDVIKRIVLISPSVCIVIKSTVPIGFCDHIQNLYPSTPILFSPEFLREDQSISDTLSPSRIIVGSNKENEAKSLQFLDILSEICSDSDVSKISMSLMEAESVKLFSNTYLAMRVAYFNELDSFAYSKRMDAKKVIRGVCLDKRIGDYYNNPSFGYGGYCLPKDSKELFHSYEGIPEEMIRSTISSNSIRLAFVVEEIKRMVSDKEKPVVGIYRLTQKKGSNSIRHSVSLNLLQSLLEEGIEVIVYEPTILASDFLGAKVINNLEKFLSSSDIIAANRYEEELEPAKEKVFTRDIFHCL